MLGLRPRLRARHSLFDLVQSNPSPRKRETGRPQLFDEDIDDLPPLPASPAPSPSLRGGFVLQVESPRESSASEASESSPPQEPVQLKMAPVSLHRLVEAEWTLTASPIHSPRSRRSATREMNNMVGFKLRCMLQNAKSKEQARSFPYLGTTCNQRQLDMIS